MTDFRWATLRLARYDEPVSFTDAGPVVDDAHGSTWLLGSDDMVSQQRIGSRTSHVWACLGLHRGDPGEGEQDVVGPYGDVLASAAERWSAVLAPYSHRGETNWSPGPLFEPGNRRSYEGPFIVVTTAGFVPERDADGARVRDFVRGVAQVRAAFAEHAEVLTQHAFWFGRTWLDPLTLTVWSSDGQLRPAVYEPGEHRSRMDDYHRRGTADRTSFTRLRVLRADGTWDSRPLPA